MLDFSEVNALEFASHRHRAVETFHCQFQPLEIAKLIGHAMWITCGCWWHSREACSFSIHWCQYEKLIFKDFILLDYGFFPYVGKFVSWSYFLFPYLTAKDLCFLFFISFEYGDSDMEGGIRALGRKIVERNVLILNLGSFWNFCISPSRSRTPLPSVSDFLH